MPIANYATMEEVANVVNGNVNDTAVVKQMLIDRMSGIEGLPYQFMENVDRRITGTSMGRKYTEKIISRIPLLFLTPCQPLFMDDFSDEDRSSMLSFLITGQDASEELINGNGRYYSVKFDYTNYYNYLNCMLSAVAAFLGIYDETITINGKTSKIGTFSWQNELNDSFKSFFSSSENVIFYLDGLTSVSESYSNDTTESALASQINGYSDITNEIKFLFGEKGGAFGALINSGTEIVSSLAASLSNVVGSLGGGIVKSLAESGVNTVLNGGKIVFPEIWSDSSQDRSYSLEIKLRSPDHDSLSIFLNVLKPYCKLLALTLPRVMDGNPNGYQSPFLVKAFCKGLFNIDMGIISSMNVTKGDECCWNDDGLPTQIDISIDIKDLYSSLAMSGFDNGKITAANVVSNTAYMDFLANMAGLNIAQKEVDRRITMFYYLTKTRLTQIPSQLFTRLDQSISNIIGNLYQRLN